MCLALLLVQATVGEGGSSPTDVGSGKFKGGHELGLVTEISRCLH